MFLFTKKTRNIIKWFWGIFATLIILSMVVTYSGFTMLARTSTPNSSIELTEEELAQLRENASGTTTADGATVQDNIDEAVGAATSGAGSTIEEPPIPASAPTVPELRFDI